MGQGYLLIAISLDHQSRNEKDYGIYIKPVATLDMGLSQSTWIEGKEGTAIPQDISPKK